MPIFQLLEECLKVPSIEAPLTLLQEPVEALPLDSVEVAQVTPRRVPEILNPVDVALMAGKES